MVGVFDKIDNMSVAELSNAIDATLGIKGTLGVGLFMRANRDIPPEAYLSAQ